MRLPSGDHAGALSSSELLVRRTGVPSPSASMTYTSAVAELFGSSAAAWLVNTIFLPSGDQSASSSIAAGLFVMFFGLALLARRPSTVTTKMSLSLVAAPGSALIGRAAPEAEA